MKPRLVLIGAIAVVLAAAAVVIVLVTRDAEPDLGHCPTAIGIFFKTDEAMRQAATAIEGDPKIAKVTATTKQEGYEKVKRSLAGKPEILKDIKPEFTPASLEVTVRDAADKQQMIEQLTKRLPDGLVRDACAAAANPTAAALPSMPNATSPRGGSEAACPPDWISIFFKTDEQMRKAADQLQTDVRITGIKRETKAEAYVRYKKIFADQPELRDLARPESLPATVGFTPSGVDKHQLIKELETRFPDADQVKDVCEFSDRMSERMAVPPTR